MRPFRSAPTAGSTRPRPISEGLRPAQRPAGAPAHEEAARPQVAGAIGLLATVLLAAALLLPSADPAPIVPDDVLRPVAGVPQDRGRAAAEPPVPAAGQVDDRAVAPPPAPTVTPRARRAGAKHRTEAAPRKPAPKRPRSPRRKTTSASSAAARPQAQPVRRAAPAPAPAPAAAPPAPRPAAPAPAPAAAPAKSAPRRPAAPVRRGGPSTEFGGL